MKVDKFQWDFNKNINRYFDTKYIYKKKTYQDESCEIEKIINNFKYLKKIKYKQTKNKKIFNLKNFDEKSYLSKDHLYRKKVLKIRQFIKNNNLKKYFNIFLIHGSLASLDYVKGWSDVDTFVVIKNQVLSSKKKLLKLKIILKKMYKLFFTVTKLQHHGLIIFTEIDLDNYLNNYMPIEALKYNLNFLNTNKIIFKKRIGPNKKIFEDLIARYELLKKSKYDKKYMHHPKNNKYLKVPIKARSREMYQLFCHLGFVNTLPAYYFSAIGKSCCKKDSFKLFEKTKLGKKIKKFLKKSENVRKKWKVNEKKIFTIPVWVTKELGKNYIRECEKNFKFIINEIKKKNNY